MKAIKVKVTEPTSGYSFIETFRNAKAAKRYLDYINSMSALGKITLVGKSPLVAEIVEA